jgi:membrane protease subunit HflK
VPEARGTASRTIAAANGYRESVVARAQGEAERFTLLLAEYQKAPQVTRKRLYLETMQDVMSRNPRVISGSDGNTLLLQLPSAAASQAPTPNNLITRPEVQAQAAGAAPAEAPRPPRTLDRAPREGGR